MSDLKHYDIRHFANPKAAPADYGPAQKKLLSREALAKARPEIESWPGYAPTPLHEMPGLAKAAGIGTLWYKDEGQRFGLKSFKALGGPYAVFRVLAEEVRKATGTEPTSADLIAGKHKDIARKVTVCCATDGNHGRAVAWGSQIFGCRCVIYLHEHVSKGREEAIASFGAEIVRTPGHYDQSVQQAGADAAANGWYRLADTGAEDCGQIQTDIMQGYGMMAEEFRAQVSGGARPTHVIAQGGVGGLLAGLFAPLWEEMGKDRPVFISVEPDAADCLYLAAQGGVKNTVTGDLDTVMACLAAGEVNYAAWEILEACCDHFVTMPDAASTDGMRLLAEAPFGDTPIVAGESGVAGLAGILAIAADDAVRAKIGLGPDSRVLVIGSEGATDPAIYEKIVGRAPEKVAA